MPGLGYRTELQRIERDIAELSIADLFAVPINPERLTRYVYLLYQRASIAGDLAQLGAVERAIERAVPLLTQRGDLYLLKANVAFKLHKLGDVEAALLAYRSPAAASKHACCAPISIFSMDVTGKPRSDTPTQSRPSGRGMVLPDWHIFAARWAISKVPIGSIGTLKTN